MNRPKLHEGVALIEVDEPLMLTEIESDASLAVHLGERLSQHCVAVRPEGISDIVKRLQALGHMPRVTDAPSGDHSRTEP